MVTNYEVVKKVRRVGMVSRGSAKHAKREGREGLLTEGIMTPEKDHSPRLGGTSQRQNPRMVMRAS